MRVTKYQLIERSTTDGVANAMREGIAHGWQPLGGVVVAQSYALTGRMAESVPTYIQAVVKAEEQHEELERLHSIEARIKMLLGDLDSQRGVIGDDNMIEYAKAAIHQMVSDDE